MTAFVIYNKETTITIAYNRASWKGDAYYSEAAAKTALTRLVKSGKVKREDYDIAEMTTFRQKIEKMETVKNLMSGKDVVQRVNTPLCCDVSSETYWSC